MDGGRHHGPVYSMQRNPAHLKYFLTIGDWSAKIWSEELKIPIMQTRYHNSYLTDGCWSKTRAGLSLETVYKPELSRTVLFMSPVDLSDTGNYTCSSDKRSETVLVVVTGGINYNNQLILIYLINEGSQMPLVEASSANTSSIFLMTYFITLCLLVFQY